MNRPTTERTALRITRVSWLSVSLVWLVAGCVGDLPTDAQIEERIDALVQADAVVDVAGADSNADSLGADVADSGPVDADQGDATSTSDAALNSDADGADGANNVDATGPEGDLTKVIECITDNDCVGKVLGTTSCNVPACDDGTCVTKQLEKATKCAPLGVTPGECEVAECTSTGECAVQPRPDGENCGPYKCGKQCDVGVCKSAGPDAYDDGNSCTSDYCKDGQAVVHEPITDLTGSCEDGDICTKTGFCFEGACATEKVSCDDGIDCTVGVCKADEGCKFIANDPACDDNDACTIDACELKSGCAIAGFAEATVTCDDGNTCTKDDTCDGKGACLGDAVCACNTDSDCAQENLCLGQAVCEAKKCVIKADSAVVCDSSGDTPCSKSTCDPKTGACTEIEAKDGADCDDGNKCTSKSACQSGLCAGDKDVSCADGNPCTDDTCGALDGCAKTPIDGPKCDDGSDCTSGDICSKGGCVGTPKDCDDGVACTVDKCDAKTGKCASTPDNASCDDGNPCTSESCAPAAKSCQFMADDKGACDDGVACTEDTCQSGSCVGTNVCQCKTDPDCDDGNPCTADACTGGKCVTTPVADSDKKACDSADKCQQAGTGLCVAGACKAGNQPKDCSNSGSGCTVGTCEPKTGACTAVPKSDGAPCDADGTGCTVNDYCKSGACTEGAAPDCAKSDGPCAVGVCAKTGPASYECKAENKPPQSACEDGKFCTQGDTCDAAGKCTAGKPLSCAEVGDVCNTGTCDEAASKCVKTPKTSGESCSDGNSCTVGATCTKGQCAGGKPKPCPDGGPCTVGKCAETDGSCSVVKAASGAACSDDNACTQTDKCDAKGACIGSQAVSCSAPFNPCFVAACNPVDGKCQLSPAAKGVKCNDGESCTLNDACNGTGQCKGGSWDVGNAACGCLKDGDCKDGNECTADSCEEKKCVNKVLDGDTCDDANSCSTESKCDKSGACVGTKSHECGGAAECLKPVCDGSGALPKCSTAPKTKGTECDDDSKCTTESACSATGTCEGTKDKVCDDEDPCTDNTCKPKDGCKYPTKDCSDDNECRDNFCKKVSKTLGYCTYTEKDCNDDDPCTRDFCNKQTGACYYSPLKDGQVCYDDAKKCEIRVCKSTKCTYLKDKCVDGNDCTEDKCSKSSGKCSYPALFDNACDDKNPCTVGEKCVKKPGDSKTSICAAGKKKKCDDGNPCTTDFCQNWVGCKTNNVANGTECSDGDKCTIKDKCSDGKCDGKTRSCDDKNACTSDKCDKDNGLCSHDTVGVGCSVPKCTPPSADKCPKSSDDCLKAECKSITSSELTGGTCAYKESCIESTAIGTGD